MEKYSIEIDELDRYIIRVIFNKKKLTTWDMAKDYYHIREEFRNREEMRKIQRELCSHNETIKNHLKKMARWGLIEITKEANGTNKHSNRNQYGLIKENIKFGKTKFIDSICDSICLKTINGEIIIKS